MTVLLEFILRLLGVLIQKHEQEQQIERTENQNNQYTAARSNPRDYFDDGMLNNSSPADTSNTGSVPEADTRRQP